MSAGTFRRELGRGERVIPGLWRLRLPLPWPGVPHCNAWAIRSGDGIVLVDCGMYLEADGDQPASISQLERALAQVGLALEQVRQLVITHAHIDHWGQSATVKQRSGCELWMHPNHAHGTAHGTDHDHDSTAALAHTMEIARAGGVPERTLLAYLDRIKDTPAGIAAFIHPDHELVNGVTIESDLGTWTVHETPGHAPSHICLFEPERRVLISGDHLLGRISLYYDYGWSADPIAEFLASLDLVETLDARLCLSGHGKPFTDVRAHVIATRRAVADRLTATRAALDRRPRTALELIPSIYGEQLIPETAAWRLTEALCVLQHLCFEGFAARESDGPTERWYQP